MTAISSACYIEDVMIGAPDSTTRDEVSQLVEMAARLSPAELSDYLNDHMKSRMFVVGKSITVADITLFSTMIQYWHSLDVEAKLAKPHCFRWIDHVQHLPGMWDQIQARNLSVEFPVEEEKEELSKAQQKKLDKAKWAADQKANKAAGGAPEEKKSGPPAKIEKQVSTGAASAKSEKKPVEKKQAQAAKPAQKKGGAPAATVSDIGQMDIVVGKIIEVTRHPDEGREHIYCEKVDIGNGVIRTIGSGLVNFIKQEDMMGAMVVVLANLKARNMGPNFASHGMVLAGQEGEGETAKIELVTPPAGCQPVDKISFAGEERCPPE